MKTKTLLTILLSLILSSGWGQQLTQTFSWHGLTLNYPSDYKITDKEYDSEIDMYSFCCEYDSEEVISMVQIGFYSIDELSGATTDFKQEFCEESVSDALSEMRSNATEFRASAISQNTSLSYPNSYCTFSHTIMGIKIQGKIVAFIKSNYLIFCVIQTETSSQMQTVESIVKSIKVN